MKKYTIDQNGRSMIEMLGVLAIVGVLSVAGIAGYSKAMAKYKVNKLMDQASTLAANTKTLFAAVGSYAGLSGNERAYALGLFPDDMVKACEKSGSNKASCEQNGMNGGVTIVKNTYTSDNDSFAIQFTGLTKDACTALFTSDWGGAAGFKGISANSAPTDCDGTAASEIDDAVATCTPANLTTKGVYTLAKDACKGDDLGDKDYTITWIFY